MLKLTMTFNELKNIKIKNSGGIFKFENYKIYVIPRNKLGFGISPLIDKVIDSKIKLSDSCISSRGRSISDDYIKYTLKKPNTLLLFVTKTLEHKKRVWKTERFDKSLRETLKTLDLGIMDNAKYFNEIRKQLKLRPIIPMSLKRNPERYRGETLDALAEHLSPDSTRSSGSSRRSSSSRSSHTGGNYEEMSIFQENLVSYMFINRDHELDYTIDLVCTTKILGFDPNHETMPEYKFPWATFLLYVFLKSVGKRGINLYNYASGEGNIGYYKRFLFNLGDKPCESCDMTYKASQAIAFNLLEGPSADEKRKLSELVDCLPSDYKKNFGYKMKICDTKSAGNKRGLIELEKYLDAKWGTTFNLDDFVVSKSNIKTHKPLTSHKSLTKFSSASTFFSSSVLKKLTKKTRKKAHSI